MWRTIGHEKVLNSLKRGLLEERLAHAYLLAGPRHVGRKTLALDIAAAVNCVSGGPPCWACDQCIRISNGLHTDVRVIGMADDVGSQSRPKSAIGLEQIKDVVSESNLKPYEGLNRVFIVEDSEQLTDEAANCLLKILEEPPDQVLFILLVTKADDVLDTIVSRCQTFDLKPLPISLVAQTLESLGVVDQNEVDRISKFSRGMLGWAINSISHTELVADYLSLFEAIEQVVYGNLVERFDYAAKLSAKFRYSREEVKTEMRMWLTWWRDLLLVCNGLSEFVVNFSRIEGFKDLTHKVTMGEVVFTLRAIQKTCDRLDSNVNPRLAIENLMLGIPDLSNRQ